MSSLANNPLKQYFRRPAVHLKLPSGGKFYDENVIDMPVTEELPVYPMTAIDEVTIKTPDALFNGSAVADLITSCVPNIKDPWRINNVDLDAILIAIRAASGSANLEIETNCPGCKESSTYGVNLINVLGTMEAPNYNSELDVNELKIKFKPLTYKEMNEANMAQFELQKIFVALQDLEDEKIRLQKTQEALKNVTDLTIRILAMTISHVRTPQSIVTESEFIIDFLTNCDKIAYNAIRDYQTKLKEKTALKPLEVKCIKCQHDYQQPFTLNATDFFG